MSSLHAIGEVVRLRAKLQALWARSLWEELPEQTHPAAISGEEVDGILAGRQTGPYDKLAFFDGNEEADGLIRQLVAAERVLSMNPRWGKLVKVFDLGRRAQNMLLCAVAVAVQPFLGRVYAYLHDQPELVHPTPWLAASLFDDEALAQVTSDSALVRWGLLRPALEAVSMPDSLRSWAADPAIVDFLGDQRAGDLGGNAILAQPKDIAALQVLDDKLIDDIVGFLRLREGPTGAAVAVELVGPEGSGRKTIARQVAGRLELATLAVKAGSLLDGVPDPQAHARVLGAVRMAILHDAVLLWEEDGPVSPHARKALEGIPGILIVLREAPVPVPAGTALLWRSFDMRPLTRADRDRLWGSLSNLPSPVEVRDWALTPGEIARLVRVAPAGAEAIRQACRRPVDSLSLLSSMPQPFAPEDLILPESIKEQLDSVETQVRLRWDVYEDWGFERLCPNGRGIIALFAGPSGTGKTMAAQVMAKRLDLELFRLDPSQVVNKYIGETEKRLKTIFDECDRSHFMLLIDECEGMFGQRFNSKDAHDRYANLEIDYLLQRLERFQGVAILSTNRKSDIDSAFLRRIRFVIDFLPPSTKERIDLWKSAIPEHSPSSEVLRGTIDWEQLGEKAVLTGAEIKLAALNAAFIARSTKEKIGMPHILTAIRRELAKKGQTLRGFE